MPQKKAKPIDPKGKSKSGKSLPPKLAPKAAKPAAPSSAGKSVMSKAAPAAAVKKSPTMAATTIKKPSLAAKPIALAAVKSSAVVKNSIPKADMTKTAAKKAEPVKASVVKPAPVLVKPSLTAGAPTKAAAPVVKAVAAVKPIVAAVKVAAPTTPAKAATPAPAKVAPVGAPKVAASIASRAAALIASRVAAPVAPKPAIAPAAIKPAAIKPVAPAAKAPIAAPVAATAPSEPKKPVSARHGFKTGEWIVYPAQGVGRIVAIEEQEIAGMKLELFVITFEKDKMTLRVPTGKAATVGMRKLAEEGIVKRAMETLKGKARIKRTMWSRRAQEFEAKINSGDLVSVAEVVRDLYRAESQPEQSYSERLLFERALDRMAREIAAVDKLDERGAAQRIVEVLSKSAKARRPVTEEVSAGGDDDADEATAAA